MQQRPGRRVQTAPEIKPQRVHPAGEIAAEQADQLGHTEVGEGSFARRLQLSRQRSAEIGLDLRPTERPEVISVLGDHVDGALAFINFKQSPAAVALGHAAEGPSVVWNCLSFSILSGNWGNPAHATLS